MYTSTREELLELGFEEQEGFPKLYIKDVWHPYTKLWYTLRTNEMWIGAIFLYHHSLDHLRSIILAFTPNE
jgi:hypothetical protein